MLTMNTSQPWRVLSIAFVMLLAIGFAPHAEAQATRPTDGSTTKPAASAQIPKGTVIFHGGFDTDPHDRGRPVVLVAAGLNVPADVFRKAFSGVKPASAGQQPQPDQVRLNKEALLKVLAPYGVTNDRLDTVSNYYRYSRSRGQMWKTSPATAMAVISNGVVTGFKITNAGEGYSSPPTISVAGYDDMDLKVELAFGTDLASNGSIKTIKLVATNSK